MSALLRKLVPIALCGAGLALMPSLLTPGCPSLLPSAQADGKKWKYYGAATCTGASCHASDKQLKERPANEFTTWQDKDRHAKAVTGTLWDTETYPSITDMKEALEIEDVSKSAKCLKCHSTNQPKALQGDKYNFEDGVSCDGCHGPAEGWFKPHTKPHKYPDMIKLGMWDTRNMHVRATVCVSCHLQIDGEIVDAGHPDLTFELYNHLLREPPHWFERQTWSGVRIWSVGQAVSMKDGLLKIANAIKNADPKAGEGDDAPPDYVKFAIQQTNSYAGGFKHAIAAFGTDAAKKALAEIAPLLIAEKGKRDEKKLAASCATVATAMDDFGKHLASVKFTKAQCATVYKSIVGDKALVEGATAFSAEQIGGALQALWQSWTAGEKAQRKLADLPAALKAIDVKAIRKFEAEGLFDDEGYLVKAKFAALVKAAAGVVK